MAEKNVLGDSLRKVFLASVGAVATMGDKAGEIVDGLASRGEQAVSQGREINHELTRRAADVTSDARDSLLKTRLELMGDEERADFLESVTRLTAQVNAERAAKKAQQAAKDAKAEPVVIPVDDAPAAAAQADQPADEAK